MQFFFEIAKTDYIFSTRIILFVSVFSLDFKLDFSPKSAINSFSAATQNMNRTFFFILNSLLALKRLMSECKIEGVFYFV